METIAKDIDIAIDLVRTLYEEKVALLSSNATITQYIDVVACQRTAGARKLEDRKI